MFHTATQGGEALTKTRGGPRVRRLRTRRGWRGDGREAE